MISNDISFSCLTSISTEVNLAQTHIYYQTIIYCIQCELGTLHSYMGYVLHLGQIVPSPVIQSNLLKMLFIQSFHFIRFIANNPGNIPKQSRKQK